MQVYAIREMSPDVRCRWVHDEMHETRGSYAYDTDAETRAAEDEEIANLASGEWVVLGCIVEKRCPTCDTWSETDSLWGIVVKCDADLDALARDQMGVE